MARKYGAPYVGSKNNIAEDVINFLPAGKRLCDLFGGGGAITHCALTYGRNKYESVLYNDVNPMVVDYVKNAFYGKYDMDVYEPEIITREKFHDLKTVRGDVAFLWSFGNNGIDYLWGKEIEENRIAAFAMLTRKSVSERYSYYKKFMSLMNKSGDESKSLTSAQTHIEVIERANSISSIPSVERVQFTNIDYSEYEYEDGDVVYCDIPYEKIAKNTKVPYKKFDHKKFYDWAYSRPYPVYISSYGINDSRFEAVAICMRRQLLCKTPDDGRIEFIYMNRAAVEEKSCEMLML